MKKRNLSIILSFITAAALIYLILRKIPLSEIALHVKNLDPWWTASAIILYTIDMALRAVKWKDILKDNNVNITTADSFMAYNLGNTVNIIIPAKLGDAARSYYLNKKYGHPYSLTLPSIFIDRVFDVLGVYMVLLVSGIYVLNSVTMPPWFFTLIAAGVAGLIIVFIAMLYILKNRAKVDRIKNKAVNRLVSSLIEGIKGSVKNKYKFIRLTVVSGLIWLCDGVFTYFIFLALGRNISPLAAIFVVMVATLTKVIPVTPGGIGVFEGTMAVILSLFGQDAAFSAILSTLSHFLMNLYTGVIGIYVLITSNIRISDIRKVNK